MYAFYKKVDSEYQITQDIYNDNGILLLGKGQKVTKEIIDIFERNWKHKIEMPNVASYKQREIPAHYDSHGDVLIPGKSHSQIFTPNDSYSALTSVTRKFAEKMNICDNSILEKPNKMLINIIFESRNKPWWIYVNALSNYIDWLYTHSIDVALISMMIAAELGYSDEELTNLGIGTLLHDVGKLLIPKHILQSPERLTIEEMFLVRKHCELGVSSLEGFDLPKEYLNIAMQHHERLDGSGYPKGLKKDEICRNAKIAMVADTVDAITSFRPYRQPEPLDVAIKELRNGEEKYPQELISLLEKILK